MSLYLYGLADAAGAGVHTGLAGEPLRWVEVHGIHAAVGEQPAAPEVSPEAVKGHDLAARALAAEVRAFLPARFGSVVADERALADALHPRIAELREALELVAGREQMTLRILAEDGGVHALPVEPPEGAGAGPGTRYLLARKAEQKALHTAPELEPVRPALSRHVHAERIERHKKGAILVSVFHLVTRGEAPAYKAALSDAGPLLQGLKVAVSGPWPAYAFAPEALA